MTNVEKQYIENNATLRAYAWPGGYPLFYLCPNGDTLCPKCAESILTTNRAEALLVALGADNSEALWGMFDAVDATRLPSETPTEYDANWEDTNMYCEECNDIIESAYGE